MAENTPWFLYPHNRDYSQTLIFKLTLNIGDPAIQDPIYHRSLRCVEDILEHIQKIDEITLQIPKIAILVGFQQGGHDRQYPQFGPVDSSFYSIEHPEYDSRHALVYLMEQAAACYHTNCTVHVNVVDGYPDSPLWDLYVKEGLICREEDGSFRKGWFDSSNNRQAYTVNLKAAWENGRIQEQIDSLMEQLPPIQKTGALYLDANCVFSPSPADGVTEADQVETTRQISVYMKEKYQCDVFGEYGLPEQYGFVAHGLTWDAQSAGRSVNPLQLPAYIMAGGTANCGSCLQMEVFGYSVQLGFTQNTCDFATIRHDFCCKTLPYFYLNRHLRLLYSAEEHSAVFSDGVVSTCAETENRYSH